MRSDRYGLTGKMRNEGRPREQLIWPPLIIAHRGASGEAPENTLAAFELALRQGAGGIELDVHLSSDGIPVVIHDPRLSRTTSGKGWVGYLFYENGWVQSYGSRCVKPPIY